MFFIVVLVALNTQQFNCYFWRITFFSLHNFTGGQAESCKIEAKGGRDECPRARTETEERYTWGQHRNRPERASVLERAVFVPGRGQKWKIGWNRSEDVAEWRLRCSKWQWQLNIQTIKKLRTTNGNKLKATRSLQTNEKRILRSLLELFFTMLPSIEYGMEWIN